MLAADAARLYEMHTVPEVAWILEQPLDTVQRALADYGVLTDRAAAGFRAAGWSVEEIANEWGMSKRRILAMIAREEGK